jgi:branched-chain amino acid transport system substrate-binding protein
MKKSTGLSIACAAALLLVGAGRCAWADIVIAVPLSISGPASSVGTPNRNATTLWPSEIGGEKLKVIVQDDRSDPTEASTVARRLIEDDKADIIVGGSTVPVSLAISAVANEKKTPFLMLSPTPWNAERDPWSFNLPQSVPLMASVVFDDMRKKGIKSVGFIGFSDSWGDQWLAALQGFAAKAGVKVVDEERYGRADTSVQGQALKLLSSHPDAILVGGTSTAAAPPQIALREIGFVGPIYHTHGAVGAGFLKIAGDSADGALAASGPVLLAEDLPATSPIAKPAHDFIAGYESRFGAGTRTPFAAHSYDASIVLGMAIPVALKSAKPGTAEFRVALRNAIENLHDVGATQGVYNFSPSDHNGLDNRARILVVVKDGKWRLVGE